MSLAIITIEQISPDRWTAEVEVGGLVCRRRDRVDPAMRATTFEGALEAVRVAYREFIPLRADPMADVADGMTHGTREDAETYRARVSLAQEHRPLTGEQQAAALSAVAMLDD